MALPPETPCWQLQAGRVGDVFPPRKPSNTTIFYFQDASGGSSAPKFRTRTLSQEEQGAWPPAWLQGDPGGRLWGLTSVARAPGGHQPRQVCGRRGPAPGPSIRPLIFQHPLASRGRDGWAPGPADRCEITQRPDKP